MDIRTRRFSFSVVAFFFIWWTFLLTAIFVYWPEVDYLFSHAQEQCSTIGIGKTLSQAVQPKFWLGWLAIFLTSYVIFLGLKKLSSRWAWISDLRWHLAIILIGLLLLIPLAGCHA
jgi:hypothetical protein